MTRIKMVSLSWLVASSFTLGCTVALAGDLEEKHPDTMLLAGEIILGPVKAGNVVSSPPVGEANAGRSRKAARDYRKEQVPAQEIVVVPADEEGVLSPRQAPSGASENAARARATRQGDAGSAVVLPPAGISDGAPHADETPAATSARRNRAKASEYRTGDRGTSVAIKGSDNLPIVDCANAENVSGRIGDDTRSGSVITLIQGSNQIKVRCR